MHVQVSGQHLYMPLVGFVEYASVNKADHPIENASFFCITVIAAQARLVTDLQMLPQFVLEPVEMVVIGEEHDIVPVDYSMDLPARVKEACRTCSTSLKSKVDKDFGVRFLPESPGVSSAITAPLEMPQGAWGQSQLLGHSGTYTDLDGRAWK